MTQVSSFASRRRFLSSAASLAALPLAAATPGLTRADGKRSPVARPAQGGQSNVSGSDPQRQPRAVPRSGEFPIKAISSDNGLEAVKRAYDLLVKGEDTLSACIAGVTIVENDPSEHTVGLGGLPNEDGVVELDAAVMHGPRHTAGSVAALRGIKNPAQVARLVMEQTDHVLLVGEGALRFAKAMGFKEEELLTEEARKIWLYWKQTRGEDDDWLPPPKEDLDPAVRKFFERPTGTIHLAGMNAEGDISCVTSTSGLAFKLPGRVGDSPIIGAGLFVDNEVGSCGSTGRGEANLQELSSFAAVELMRGGLSPQDAGLEVLRRVARHTVPRLKDDKGRPTFNLTMYLLGKDGAHAGVAMRSKTKFTVCDAQGPRLEECVALYELEDKPKG